ncbi:hypothetical protein JOD45_000299 [Scopulibacillus daqui]|uniref:Holin n=1 Tax=Scopulibacillus daqui TaxID=1469162 RepID=A0ABS2PVW4_9BACL|nr:hypothetical protein [Scopulibacillus daqui]MBM7644108.1 hypothetical protein [Scopulibacillus daqui]
MADLLSIHFGAYIALAFVLYAIHEATGIHNRYIPIAAVILGFLFAWFEAGEVTPHVLLKGIQYGLYGVGSVATVKYVLEKAEKDPKKKE